MKYYLEYKNKEEFTKIVNHYDVAWGYVDPEKKTKFPPGAIIENNKCKWKYTYEDVPTDAKKITFAEWEEMIKFELTWKVGAYIKYLGTKEGKSSGINWENCFGTLGLKAGDVGIINSKESKDAYFFIKDNIRGGDSGRFTKQDLQLITKEEYEAGLRDANIKINTTPTQYISIEMFLANPHNYHFYLTKQEEVDAVFDYLEFLQEKIDRKSIVFIPESWSYIVYKNNKWRIDNIPNGDSQLMDHEEFLKCRPFNYKFNEGDLVVVTKFLGQTTYNNGDFRSGEIIQLGGQYWNTEEYTLDKINTFESIAFISKNSSEGNGYSNQTNTEFRHCTPEEVAYFKKVGLGANINDMKKPFDLDAYVPKGELKNIPKDIIKVMLQRQVEQGNPEDVTIFESNIKANNYDRGFRWSNTPEVLIWSEVVCDENFDSFYEFHKPKDDLPFKIGDEVTILSKPNTWSEAVGGKCGLSKVMYPYTFIVENIAKSNPGKSCEHIAIFDGTYGWTYYKNIFVKAEPKEDDSWKIAVHTDNKQDARPYMITYLLSLHDGSYNIQEGFYSNYYYYLNDKKRVDYSYTCPKGYKIIEECDLPNYPKKEDMAYHPNTKITNVMSPTPEPTTSTTELKWAVKHSEKVGLLLSKVIYNKSDTTYQRSGYRYLVYPQYKNSSLFDTILPDYVEITEQEAIERLTAILNKTPLITTGVSTMPSQPEKKQSLTEQLCKIIEKEPDNIPVTSLFPTKRKSIINQLLTN